MKTRTLIVAAMIVSVLMLISYVPRGGADRVLNDPIVPEAVQNIEDVEPLTELMQVAQTTTEDAGTTEVVEELDFDELVDVPGQIEVESDAMTDVAVEDTGEDLLDDFAGDMTDEPSELIELETERELSPGIEVMMDDEGKDLISITLDDVPLQDVVRMFTRISGANIVAGTNLTGAVTVSLQDVEWEPAFRVILDTVDMVLVQKTPGIYSIMSKRDLAGEPVTVDTVFLKYTTVSNVLPVVERMMISTNASVAPFPSANALVIQETVERINTIREVIDQIDKPRPQVYIEAKFVELNEQAVKDLGIDWSVLGSDGSGSLGYTFGAKEVTRSYTETRRQNSPSTAVDFNLSRFVDKTDRSFNDLETGFTPDNNFGEAGNSRNRSDELVGTALEVGGRNFTAFDLAQNEVDLLIPFDSKTITSSILSAADFSLTLSALNQDDGVDVVSNPKVIVANEETANIHVGVNEPNVVAVPQGDTGDRFAYALDSQMPFIEIGVKLEVTPTVNTEDNITVKLIPELSRLLGQKQVGEGATQISFPITSVRRVSTEFSLESGDTVAIGGLTETTDVDSVNKIPLLGDIPLVGKYFFRHTHTERKQDEVIIFVTVGLANPESLVEVAGIPAGGRLVHEYLARQAQDSEY